MVEQAAGYALVNLVSGEVTPIDAQARGTSIAVSGDSVLIFYGSQDPGAPATVDTFDALSGEVTGRFELPGTVEIGTRLIAFLQQGRIAIYLLYSFVTLLSLLVLTRG